MALLRYIRNKKETFDESPVNQLDVLAFTWLTYFDLRPLDSHLPVRIGDLKGTDFDKNLEKLHQTWVPSISAKLFRAMMDSPRYRDAEIIRNEETSDVPGVYQFGAIAVRAGGKVIVAYEGTDLSAIGWREDCVMSYSDKIGSYPIADRFYEEVTAATTEPIIISGHSKGGNVAVYVAAKTADASRVEKVYSYDGPGFHNSDVFAEHPEREALVTKYIPQGSIVGILLNSNAHCTIVRSYSIGVFQHNAIKWSIEGDDFIHVDKLSLSSRFLDAAANQWISELAPEEKARFVELLFGPLGDQKISMSTLFKDLARSAPALALAFRDMAKEDRRFMFLVIKQFAKTIHQTGRASLGFNKPLAATSNPKPKKNKQ